MEIFKMFLSFIDLISHKSDRNVTRLNYHKNQQFDKKVKHI